MPVLLTALAALVWLASGGPALANTWNVGCPGGSANTTLSVTYVGGAMNGMTSSTANFAVDPGGNTGTGAAGGAPDALGALLGTPVQASETSVLTTDFGAGLAADDTIEITGGCIQDVTITTPLLTINNHTGSNSPSTDGDQGQIEIADAHQVVLRGLLIGVNSGSFSFATGSDQALVYAHDGAEVVVEDCLLSNSPLIGLLATNASSVQILNTFIAGSGSAAVTNAEGVGVTARNNSSIILASPDDTALTADIESNKGGGVTLSDNSTLYATGSSIDSNSGVQLFLNGSSGAHINDMPIDGSTCSLECGDAIDAIGTSTVRLDGGVTVAATQGHSAIDLVDGSALLASGATITVQNNQPTILASENSVVALAGGNEICSNSSGAFCDNSAVGTAVQVDHVSTLIQVPAAQFGYTAAADTISGAGTVQLQSTIDVGLGTISGGQSMNWNSGTGGVSVAQNSSFRLEGGATITGKVKLSQGSNGFFNTANGGTNTVTSGVTCPFTAIPAAHVVAATANALSPTPSLATGFFTASANQCLPF